MSSYTIPYKMYHERPLFKKIAYWPVNHAYFIEGYRYTNYCDEYFRELFDIVIERDTFTLHIYTFNPDTHVIKILPIDFYFPKGDSFFKNDKRNLSKAVRNFLGWN